MGAEFLGGLAQGAGAGYQQATEKRQQMDILDIQKKLLKAQAKAAELELEKKAKMGEVMEQGLEQVKNQRPDQTLPAPYANAGQPAPDLLEIMSQAALAGGDIGQLLKVEGLKQKQAGSAGFDAAWGQPQGNNPDYSQSMTMDNTGKRTIRRDPVRGVMLPMEQPDGSVINMLVNPMTGQPMGGMGTPSGAIRTKPPAGDMPAPQEAYNNYITPEGETPQGQTSLNDLANNYIRVTPKQREGIDKSKNAMAILNEFNSLASRYFPKLENTLKGRGKAGVAAFVNQWTQTDPDAVLMQNMGSELVTIVRALGDVGAISDPQLNQALNLIPKVGGQPGQPLPDTATVAKDKLNKLYRIITTPYADIEGMKIPTLRDPWEVKAEQETPIPQSALDLGVTPELWQYMPPDARKAFQ